MAKRTKLQKKQKYRSKILRAIHQTARGLHSAGILSDERLISFNDACLIEPKPQLKIKVA